MQLKMKKNIVLVMLCAMMVFLVACGSGSSTDSGSGSDSKESIKIGLVAFLSGAGAPWANSMKNAGNMAVDEINEKGGVMGRKVELIINDSNSDPSTGNRQAKSLIDKDNVSALFTADTSATRNALYPIINNAKIPFFYTIVYEGGEYQKYMYVNGAVPQQVIDPVIPYLTKEQNAKKWFIVGNDYVFPRKTSDTAKADIQKEGGSVVGEEYAPLGTSDYSAVIAKIKSAEPDFILQVLVGSDAVSFNKQLSTQGLTKKPKILAVAVEENSVKAMGSSAEGIYATGEYFQAIETPANQDFIKKYKAKFGNNADLQTFMSLGIYEAIHMWAMAANKANSLEWSKINGVIGDIKFEGPRGLVQYETKTNHSKLPIYLSQVVDGKLKVIKDFGEIPPVK